ncbi:MAG: hypothetical protein ACOYM2_03060 [Rectinemataceae bacterium]
MASTAVLVAVIASFTYFNRARADDMLSVTGMGSIDFSSDIVTWQGSYDTGSRKKTAT